MRKKLKTTVYLEPDQFATLQVLSARLKVHDALLIREGIDLVLREMAEGRGLMGLAAPRVV